MKKNPRNWVLLGFKSAAGLFLLIAVTLIVAASIKLNSIMHPPRRVSSGSVLMQWKIAYQPVDLLTDDGIRLSAWYTPPRNNAVILVAHSYGDHRPEWVYEMLVRKGYGVLAWDARAHGTSGGDTSTIGLSEVLDVKAALNYVLAQPNIEHIGAWGGSMGGATMIRATAQYPQIEAVFVDSSFTSLSEELDFMIPYPMLSPLAKVLITVETGKDVNDVNPLADIAKISPRPVFIAQGTGDTAAPPDSAQRLFEAAGQPRFLWTEGGVSHLGLYFNNPRRYKRRLVDFFDQSLLKKMQ